MISLREPLLLFTLLGGLIFAGYYYLQNYSQTEEKMPVRSIAMDDVTYQRLIDLQDKLGDQAALLESTQPQVQKAVNHWLEQNLLLQEALARQLYLGDDQIENRLVQKMKIILLSGLEPVKATEDEISAYYEVNKALFLQPATYDFEQLFMGKSLEVRDRQWVVRTLLEHGEASVNDIVRELEGVWVKHNLPLVHQGRTSNELKQIFGGQFETQIEGLELNLWSGPIESGFGLHWVRKTKHVSRRIQSKEQVREKIARAVSEHRIEQQYNEALRRLGRDYEVQLP